MHRFMHHLDELAGLDMVLARRDDPAKGRLSAGWRALCRGASLLREAAGAALSRRS